MTRQRVALLAPDPTDDEIDSFIAALTDGEGPLAEHYPGGKTHNQKAHAGAGAGAAAVAAHEKPPAKDSMQAHSAGGSFTPEREALHDAAIASITSGLPTSDTPTLYMTGGGPASGKTKALLDNESVGIPGKDRAAHIDPDSMKGHLPEYGAAVAEGRPWAAAHVHEESSYMAKTGVGRALRNGHDVVYDSVGDSGIDKLHAKVAGFRAAGAKRVAGEYATVDTSVAIARAQARAKRTGRYVPESVIVSAHADVSRTYVAAVQRGTFDHLRLWDNSGSTPVLVHSYTRDGGSVVHDRGLWDAFVAKGAA